MSSQAIQFSVSSIKDGESQPADIAQLLFGRALRPAASVRSEPGSNSQVENLSRLVTTRINGAHTKKQRFRYPCELPKRSTAEVSRPTGSEEPASPQGLRRPRFLFSSSLVKERT